MIFIERVFGRYYLHGGEGREAKVLVELAGAVDILGRWP